MRLRDLNARFLYASTPNARPRSDSDPLDGAVGVLFQCPACAQGKPVEEEDGERFVVGVHYVLIHFANPINASVVPPDVDHNPRWHAGGMSLDTLTLSPSINLDVPGTTGCRWHGFVTNGDAS